MNLGIKKSDDFVGPLGWGSIFSSKISTSEDNGKVFLLLHGGNQSIAETKRELEERYFNDRINILFSDLTKTGEISALKKLVKSFFDKYKLREEEINICAALVTNDRLFVVRWGDVVVYLFRKGRSVKLIEEGNELISVEGVLKAGDSVIIASKTFFKKIHPESINSRRLNTYSAQLSREGFLDESLKSVSYTPYLLIEPIVGNEVEEKTIVLNKGDYSRSIRLEKTDYNVKSKLIDRLRHFLDPFFKKSIYTGGESYERTSRSKKTAAFIGIVLLAVLAVSIGFGIRRKNEEDFKNSYQNDLIIAKHNLEEAMEIYSLNPGRAREIFIQSRDLVEGLSQRNIDDPELTSLRSEIIEHEGEILGQYKAEPENFIDLGLLTDGFRGDKIILSDDFVYVVDKASRKIVKLGISTKRSEVLAGPNKIDEIYDVASYVDRVFVFNSEGIIEVSGAKQKVLDVELNDNLLAAAYTGNIYLLDKANSKILRFAGDGDVFNKGKDWLSSSVNLNLSSAKYIVIDGSIWVLMEDGSVHKFTQGNLQSFNFEKGLIENFHVDSIFTSDELQGLYILDSEDKKIYVFNKEGKYLAEYVSDKIKDTLSIVVSEKDKKMLLLNGNVLMSIDLKHLERTQLD